eukprot:15448196-Alexandrium_andersonii.AAC.1
MVRLMSARGHADLLSVRELVDKLEMNQVGVRMKYHEPIEYDPSRSLLRCRQWRVRWVCGLLSCMLRSMLHYGILSRLGARALVQRSVMFGELLCNGLP